MNNLCYFCQNELTTGSNCYKCCRDYNLKCVSSYFKDNKIYQILISDFKIAVHLSCEDNETRICYFASAHIISSYGLIISPANFHSKIKTILTFQ
jgi:hypothetical protein